jgi:metallo-beta-lactamase family protein
MEILSRAFGTLATNCYIAKFGDKSVVIDPGVGSFEWICENAGQILAVINTHGHFDHVWDNFFLQKSGAKIYIHKDDAFMIEDDPFGMLKSRVQADVKFNEGKIILGCDLQTKFLNSCANKFNPNFNSNLAQNKSINFSFNTQILKQNSDINLPQNSCNFGDKGTNLDEICTQNSLNPAQICVKVWHFAGHTPGSCVIEIENVLFSGDFLFKGAIGRYNFPYSSREAMRVSLEKIKRFYAKFGDFKLLPGHGESSTLSDEMASVEYYLKRLQRV